MISGEFTGNYTLTNVFGIPMQRSKLKSDSWSYVKSMLSAFRLLNRDSDYKHQSVLKTSGLNTKNLSDFCFFFFWDQTSSLHFSLACQHFPQRNIGHNTIYNNLYYFIFIVIFIVKYNNINQFINQENL